LWACIKYNERECVHIIVYFICQSQILWACIKYNARECVHMDVYCICQSQILWACIKYNERECVHLLGIMGYVVAHYIDFKISRSTFFSNLFNLSLNFWNMVVLVITAFKRVGTNITCKLLLNCFVIFLTHLICHTWNVDDVHEFQLVHRNEFYKIIYFN